MFKNVYVPYKGYWSSPFCRWQESLQNQHAVQLAAATAKKFFGLRGIRLDVFDGTFSIGVNMDSYRTPIKGRSKRKEGETPTQNQQELKITNPNPNEKEKEDEAKKRNPIAIKRKGERLYGESSISCIWSELDGGLKDYYYWVDITWIDDTRRDCEYSSYRNALSSYLRVLNLTNNTALESMTSGDSSGNRAASFHSVAPFG
jgi:hypothetical protein